jgi:hypothetical protein
VRNVKVKAGSNQKGKPKIDRLMAGWAAEKCTEIRRKSTGRGIESESQNKRERERGEQKRRK